MLKLGGVLSKRRGEYNFAVQIGSRTASEKEITLPRQFGLSRLKVVGRLFSLNSYYISCVPSGRILVLTRMYHVLSYMQKEDRFYAYDG